MIGHGKKSKKVKNLFEMMGQDKVDKFMEEEREQ